MTLTWVMTRCSTLWSRLSKCLTASGQANETSNIQLPESVFMSEAQMSNALKVDGCLFADGFVNSAPPNLLTEVQWGRSDTSTGCVEGDITAAAAETVVVAKLGEYCCIQTNQETVTNEGNNKRWLKKHMKPKHPMPMQQPHQQTPDLQMIL